MRAGRPEVGWRGQLITWEGTRAWLSQGPGANSRLSALPSFVEHFTIFALRPWGLKGGQKFEELH
jgi:hypothetical protein